MTSRPSRDAGLLLAIASFVGALLLPPSTTSAQYAVASGADPNSGVSTTQASDIPNGSGFGIVPGARGGLLFGDYMGQDVATRGFLGELYLELVYVFPRDWLGVSLAPGYQWATLTRPIDAGAAKPSFSYNGFTLTAAITAAPRPRLLFSARGGLVLGSVTTGLDASAFAAGFRMGGAMSIVAYRNYGADLVLHLEYHRIVSASVAVPMREDVAFAAHAATIAITLAWGPNAMAL